MAGDFYDAELYSCKGALTLAQEGYRLQAEDCREKEKETERYFFKAIDIACEQQAKSWELRVANTLARLWQQQGKGTKARQMLAEIYGWFTEGSDTVDLREAKELLDELSSA